MSRSWHKVTYTEYITYVIEKQLMKNYKQYLIKKKKEVAEYSLIKTKLILIKTKIYIKIVLEILY